MASPLTVVSFSSPKISPGSEGGKVGLAVKDNSWLCPEEVDLGVGVGLDVAVGLGVVVGLGVGVGVGIVVGFGVGIRVRVGVGIEVEVGVEVGG